MRLSTSLLATAAAVFTSANAQNHYKGFNYGAFFENQAAKQQADFEYEFNAAKQLPGTNGEFTSARLYTMIQWGTTNSVIQAIQAAINTKTSLLLGMWCSSGQASFNNEITALKAAIQQYGTAFTDLVVGISVGSEDLYRITPTGIANKAGAGAQPSDLLNYIKQTRSAIAGTGLAGKPVGHVDTWTAYVNASNNAVISALDFLGVDAYPYWQTTMANSIQNANATFYDAYDATVAAAQGKPVWVTETGWPVTGPTENQAVASADNARIYWEDVACSLMARGINLYYYDLQEAQYGNPSPDFGIKGAGDLMQVQPRFDVSCPSSAKPYPTGIISIERPTSVEISTFSITDLEPTSEVTISPNPTSASPPIPTAVPLALNPGSFEAPRLIIPVDNFHPDHVVGAQLISQVSSTHSTLFNFDLPPELSGMICNVMFYLPPNTHEWWQPFLLKAPGGISVARLDQPANEQTTSSNTGPSKPIGIVQHLVSGQGYLIGSGPCEAGMTVGYQVDALAGLNLEYFQMVQPASGLFVTVSNQVVE